MRNKLTKLAGSTVVAVAMASIALTAMPQAAVAERNPRASMAYVGPVQSLTPRQRSALTTGRTQGPRDVATGHRHRGH